MAMPGVVKTAPNVLITGTPVRHRAVPAAPLPAHCSRGCSGHWEDHAERRDRPTVRCRRPSRFAAHRPAQLTRVRGSRSTGLEHINVSEMVKAQGLHWCACRSAAPTSVSPRWTKA